MQHVNSKEEGWRLQALEGLDVELFGKLALTDQVWEMPFGVPVCGAFPCETIICQDRLGTNIKQTHPKRRFALNSGGGADRHGCDGGEGGRKGWLLEQDDASEEGLDSEYGHGVLQGHRPQAGEHAR